MRAQRLLWAGTLALAAAGCGPQEKSIPESAELLIQAREALAAGNDAEALLVLDDSIASQPMVWSYLERAKLKLKMGDEPGALTDCDAALRLSPDDSEVIWLKSELEKPADKRFQGQFKDPPSARK